MSVTGKLIGGAKGLGAKALKTLGPAALSGTATGYASDDWRSGIGAGLLTAGTQSAGNIARRIGSRINPNSRAFDSVGSLVRNRGGSQVADIDARLAAARANLTGARGGPVGPDNRNDFYRGLDPILQNAYTTRSGTVRTGTANQDFAALRNAIDPNTGAYDPNLVDPKIRPRVDRLHNDLKQNAIDPTTLRQQSQFDFGANLPPQSLPADHARVKQLESEIADLEGQAGNRAGAKPRTLEAMRRANPVAATAAGLGVGLASPDVTREVYESGGGRAVEETGKDVAGAVAEAMAEPQTDWSRVGQIVGAAGAVGILGLLAYKLLQDDDEEPKKKSNSTGRRGRPPGTGRPRGRPRKVV